METAEADKAGQNNDDADAGVIGGGQEPDYEKQFHDWPEGQSWNLDEVFCTLRLGWDG